MYMHCIIDSLDYISKIGNLSHDSNIMRINTYVKRFVLYVFFSAWVTCTSSSKQDWPTVYCGTYRAVVVNTQYELLKSFCAGCSSLLMTEHWQFHWAVLKLMALHWLISNTDSNLPRIEAAWHNYLIWFVVNYTEHAALVSCQQSIHHNGQFHPEPQFLVEPWKFFI